MAQPRRIGDRIARLIAVAPATVVVGDTLSIKVYQALAAVSWPLAPLRIAIGRRRQVPVFDPASPSYSAR